MKIHYHGHSALSLSDGNTEIIFDPFFTGNPSANGLPEDLKPHTILLTHGHDDHVGDTETLAKRSGATVVAVFELATHLAKKGIKTLECGLGGRVRHDWGWSKMVPAFHSSSYEGQYMGMPAGIVVDFAGVRVYNTGDTCVFGDMKLIAELYQPEVLILPVGGHYTMDVYEAKKAIELVGARCVIPVHYNTWPPLAIDVEAFKTEVEKTFPGTVLHALKPGESVEHKA